MSTRKDMRITVIPRKNPFNYHVKRTNNHTTFLACIIAEGRYLKPLIAFKRKIVEARFFRVPISDKIYISDNESGFITRDIFDDWAQNILIPYIEEKKEQLKYQSPAVLILDGCSCHYTPTMYKLCAQHSIKIFFLPPHSSNQT